MDLEAKESEERNEMKSKKRLEEKLYDDSKKKKEKFKDDSCNELILKSINIEYLFPHSSIAPKNKKSNIYH